MPIFPKSIKMLMTLTKSEVPRFKEYLESPYFNKLQRILKLFNCIEDLFIKKKMQYDELCIIKMNYGTYSAKIVRKYKFDLGKLKEHFEDFVAIQKFTDSETDKKVAGLEDFLNRSNGLLFNLQYQNLKKIISNSKSDIDHFTYKVKIEQLKANYELLYKDKREGDVNYQIVSDAIDKEFITKKLIYSVLMHARKDIALVVYDFGLKEVVIKYLNNNAKIEEPILKCLYYAHKILTSEEPQKNYKTLKELLNKYHNKIADDIKNILYIILHNNITEIFPKKRNYCIEFFELYSMLLEQDFMRFNGNISALLLKNMVSACIELDKYEYLEKFLMENRNKIYPEALAEDIFNYNFSKMLLFKGDIEKASDMIINVQIKDLYYKLALRRLEIMLCYEVNQVDRLDNLIGAFKVALTPQRAKHISEKRILTERNFINIFTEICRMYTNPNSTKKEKETLIQKIRQATTVSEQKWLLMKAELLLNK